MIEIQLDFIDSDIPKIQLKTAFIPFFLCASSMFNYSCKHTWHHHHHGENCAIFHENEKKTQKLVSSFSCSAIDLINDCSRMLDTALYSKPPKREERELYSNGPWKYSFH